MKILTFMQGYRTYFFAILVFIVGLLLELHKISIDMALFLETTFTSGAFAGLRAAISANQKPNA